MDDTNQLDVQTQLALLRDEYTSLREETQVTAQQYVRHFSIGLVFAAAAFTLAADEDYRIVFVIVPVVVLCLGQFSIASAHAITVLATRTANIERSVRELNGGIPILEWEHIYSPRYTASFIVELTLVGKDGKTSSKRVVNPIFSCALLVIVACMVLIVYSTIEGFKVLPTPMNWLFLAFVVGASFGTVRQSMAFFTIGTELRRLTGSRAHAMSEPSQ